MPLMTHEAQLLDQKKQPQPADVAKGSDGGKRKLGAQKGQARDLKGGSKVPGQGGEAHGGDEHDLVQHDDGPVPLDGQMRKRAEASLGVDLGGVRVHQGEGAKAASRDLGARAFAHGQDVFLGDGVKNDLNPVMAHEVAHTAQQQGGAAGVAAKSERGTQGGGHEVDADRAASRIMIGAPAKVTARGAEHVMCFEGAEHMDLGNTAWGGQKVTVGSVTLPAGAFTALQGDFFGTWAEMERACTTNPKLIYDYYDVLVREGKLRAEHQAGRGPEPDSNGPIMVAGAVNGRNPMEYLNLAATNFNHFSEQNAVGNQLFNQTAKSNPAYAVEIGAAQAKFGHNIAQWLNMHMEAAKRAFDDGVAGKDLGGVGVAMDAAGCHYLTDAFAAGHMRVPRMEMFNEYQVTFRAAARRQVDGMVDAIPTEIDITAMLSGALGAVADAAGGAAGTARSYLPGWANSAIDGAADLARQGADAVGITAPSLPQLKISLAGVKSAVRAKLHPIADSIGNTLGEKVAGFSAKVLHDYDNEHGVKVHNDAGMSWEAKGDHALTASKDNERIAIACTGASAKHVKDLHAAGKGHAGDRDKSKLEMPFKSLKPITDLLPQVDAQTKSEGTEPGGPRDWHWNTMSSAYKAQIKQNAIDSATGTVASAWSGIKEKVREAVEAKVREALSGLGRLADAAASKLGAIVDKILSYIPDIDPSVLIAGILK